ncbi:hypothetical protein EVAR_60818_1 [Eumeta japonica]|uniref:Uncharacterized protein n=1 Tax=Eumeta variegata TaxID=151549 RepID=A0A4C1ZW89_EUMVA|nr:hypothetical protein EVAR_60818_1 [Eumeta japonica]
MIRNEILDVVDKNLFLSLTLDAKLRWNSHITRLVKRLSPAAYAFVASAAANAIITRLMSLRAANASLLWRCASPPTSNVSPEVAPTISLTVKYSGRMCYLTGHRPPGHLVTLSEWTVAISPSRREADDRYAEREQFEKQYCALVSAAHALLDDHAPQRRRGGRLTTGMRNASSSRNSTVRSCRRLTPSWTTTRRSAVAAGG